MSYFFLIEFVKNKDKNNSVKISWPIFVIIVSIDNLILNSQFSNVNFFFFQGSNQLRLLQKIIYYEKVEKVYELLVDLI